jgi:carboxypeptidase T
MVEMKQNKIKMKGGWTMRNYIVVLMMHFLLASAVLYGAGDMVVRIYAPQWQDLQRISRKNLEIAAGRPGEWFDIVADRGLMDDVIASGLPYEVTVQSLALEKERIMGAYLNYAQINDSLRHLASNYPSICRFDSLPIKTYEGRWIYGVKISDNVAIDEFEPNFSVDGCHHSREWGTPQACLFFADSMLRSYAGVPEISEIINTTQIYVFPVINVDGYVYDWTYYQGGWRLNREPFGGAVGTDPNRNYSGGCNGDVDGCWGAADESQCSHHPGDETFCGAYGFSGDEIRAYAAYIRTHNIATGFSLHSYGEEVMWPWGYKAAGTPDATLYQQKGDYMASLMQRLGGGTYTPGQAYSNPYPTCGNARDWVYGYNHYINGISSLFYGSEIGTSFYQPQGDLDNISRQVFKAAKYLAGYADSLVIVTDGMVPPPSVYPLDTVSQDFTIRWHPKNAYDNNPAQWELVELSNPTVIVDSLESGTGRWVLQGFALSTTQSHSATHSFWSGNSANMNAAVRSLHPCLVGPGDSVTFWCYYNLENNYDVAVIEVSENTKEWFNLDTMRFTGTQTTWARKAFSLASWAGKSVYIRLRSMTDGSVNNGGFYVDDIKPSCLFGTVNTVSSSITDTLYAFTAHPVGEYYYYVRGYNAAWGWGDYSCLERLNVVIVSVSETDRPADTQRVSYLELTPNPFRNRIDIRYMIQDAGSKDHSLKIFDAPGRLVKSFSLPSTCSIVPGVITWHGDDDQGRHLPSGVYFVRLYADGLILTNRAILIK